MMHPGELGEREPPLARRQARRVSHHHISARAEPDDEGVADEQAPGTPGDGVYGPAAQGEEEDRLPDPDGDERGPEVGPGDRAARVAQSRGDALGDRQVADVDEQEVGARPDDPGQDERGDT